MIRDPETWTSLLVSISRFVDEVLIPREGDVAETNEMPDEIVAQMRGIGLFGLTIPEEFGGLGATMEEEVRVVFEIARASPAFRSFIGTNNGIGSTGIVMDGTEQQKQKYLPRLATGEWLSAFCLTEPDIGSDAASLTTRARRDGDHYIIDGAKRFITNAPHAAIFTVLARTDRRETGADGISAFVVDRHTPGLSVGKPDKKMGHNGAHTSDVIFEAVRVPETQLIGRKEGRGFKTAMKVLDKSRLHIAAASVGAAERMLSDTLSYATSRRQFGKPIAEHQLIQAMLADSKAELYAARCMVVDAAQKRDRNESVTTEASCAKLFSTEMCGRVADRCVQIHGGAGYMSDSSIERFYRDVRLFRIYEGTSQIQQIIIARNMARALR